MPFYEYECSACKFYVEALQKISDPPIKKCPSCKKQTMKKLVSAPVFRLKGGGWYETDFKSDQDKKRNLVGEDKDTSADTKTETASAAKTDAKSETKPSESKSQKESDKGGDKGGDRASSSSAKKSATKTKAKPKSAAKKK